MRKNRRILYILPAFLLVVTMFFVGPALQPSYAFSGCEENCQKCHTLSDKEVRIILDKIKAKDAKITKIQMSPVKGLWEVVIENKGQAGLLYVDFSKKYLVAGSIVEVNAAINKTQQRLDELKRIDPASVSLKNALLIGSSSADKKVIVFTDPDCPFCAKLHEEIKKVIAKRKDIAFYLKLFPLKMHPEAYWKSKSIICNKSVQLLEDNFAKKAIPKTDCNISEIDENLKFGAQHGVSGTPTIVLPDGAVRSESLDAEKIISLIDAAAAKSKTIRNKKTK